VAFSEIDIKLLWGRAAGVCSNPACRTDLTKVLETGEAFVIGEMAHVIARSPSGPRGEGKPGPDTYDNALLLCPTCHRTVDKAPEGVYPGELLHAWKNEHEKEVRDAFSGKKFADLASLQVFVADKLHENKHIFDELGPRSKIADQDPASNAVELWEARKLKTLVPNNRAIINAITANINLLGGNQRVAFNKFKLHADGFELNQYNRLDRYPLFPPEFEQEFSWPITAQTAGE
jgi:hypothetical protein